MGKEERRFMVPLAGRLLSPPPPGSGGQVNEPPPRGAGWRPKGGGSSPRRSTTPPPFPFPPCPLPLHAVACVARNAPAPPHTAVAVACRRCCSCATVASGKKTTENTQNERVYPLLAGCGQERGEGGWTGSGWQWAGAKRGREERRAAPGGGESFYPGAGPVVGSVGVQALNSRAAAKSDLERA